MSDKRGRKPSAGRGHWGEDIGDRSERGRRVPHEENQKWRWREVEDDTEADDDTDG